MPNKGHLVALVAATLCMFGALGAQAAGRVVNIFNWSDYIDPRVLEDFTRETGVKIVYDTYDSNESLETRLLEGGASYDLVFPSATFLAREIKAGLFQPLDRARLGNAKNIWPDIDARLARYDAGNRFAVPYMWYTTGVAYNITKVRERLGDKAITRWEQVLRPDALKKLADCRVEALDSPQDLFAITQNFLKLDPNSKNPDDLHRAADLLAGLRRNITKFHSTEYVNALANGDICVAIGWTGDSLRAKARAREAGDGVEIAYVIPLEGTLMSIDALAIPKDAPHPDEALLLIDYLLRPDVAARNSGATRLANGVLASKPLLDKAIADNPAIYPDAATMKTLFTVTAPEPPIQKTVTREWTRVKTGR